MYNNGHKINHLIYSTTIFHIPGFNCRGGGAPTYTYHSKGCVTLEGHESIAFFAAGCLTKLYYRHHERGGGVREDGRESFKLLSYYVRWLCVGLKQQLVVIITVAIIYTAILLSFFGHPRICPLKTKRNPNHMVWIWIWFGFSLPLSCIPCHNSLT